MKTSILVMVIAVLSVGKTAAHNCLFFPGDAFFSTEFDCDFFDGNPGEKGLDLGYDRFVGSTAKCGYAGYGNLLVKNLPEKVEDNLLAVHEIVFPKDRADAKPLPMFVYNREFPLSKPFGVKYNEDWQAVQTGEAGLDRAIYDALGGSDFVIDDWASAAEIAPLAISDGRDPMVKPDGETGVVETALEIDGSEVMFVVLSGGDGEVVRFGRREEGLVFFVVSEQLRRYRFDRRGMAMPQEVDARFDGMAAKREQISLDQSLLRAALRVYASNFGTMPTEEQGLEVLVERPPSVEPKRWMPSLKVLPTDPWGNPYRWDGDVLFSLGADGVRSSDDVVEPFVITEDGVLIPPAEGG